MHRDKAKIQSTVIIRSSETPLNPPHEQRSAPRDRAVTKGQLVRKAGLLESGIENSRQGVFVSRWDRAIKAD